MKYRILDSSLTGRKAIIRNISRWVIYIILLILFTSIQMTLPFINWQPMLTILLSCAVSAFESEFSGFIFSLFCGFMTDIATGGLFGVSVIWIAPCCLMIKLLVVNLIHRNYINFLWLNSVTLLIYFFAELFFKHIIWRRNNIDIIISQYYLPSFICSVVLSFPVFILIKFIFSKLRTDGGDSDLADAFFDD